MKKKLAAIDMRLQILGVVLGLVVVTFLLHMFLVSPQGAKATKIQSQIDAVDAQIAQRRLDLKKSGTPPTIQVADLFKLSRAMPDQADMPGIILTLSEVAREAGISFDLIEPAQAAASAAAPVPVTTGYQSQRMHLVFNGDFYGLSDFLYRLRSLVVVHDGKLRASGRLFNASSVSFKVSEDKFPKISAELYVDAYVYAPAPPAAATPPATGTTDGSTPTTTTTTTTDSTTTTPAPPAAAPSGATAAGATP